MRIKDRYEYDPVTDLIGKGGFARVFRAEDTLLNREVALKVFAPGERDQYSVLQEIRKAIQLEHPNLLRYYDVVLLEQSNALGEKEELQIGVMEYANAGDLKSYARTNPNSNQLKRFLRETLNGLHYLHDRKIIHRDLKAQNILLVERAGHLTAKISDFGISKTMSGEDTRSSSMLVGTIEYMAPEQFNPKKFGIDGKVHPNVDFWGFGVMVHELLTETTPFGKRSGDTSAEQIMASILSPDLPPGIDELPEPYRSVVKKCLVAHAKDRVQSASELLAMLEDGYAPAVATPTVVAPVAVTHAVTVKDDAGRIAEEPAQLPIMADDGLDSGSGTIIFRAERDAPLDTAPMPKWAADDVVDPPSDADNDAGYGADAAMDRPFWKKYGGTLLALVAIAFLGFAAFRTMNADDGSASAAVEVTASEAAGSAAASGTEAAAAATETANAAGEAAAAAGAAAAAAATAPDRVPTPNNDQTREPKCEEVCTMVPGKTTTSGGSSTVNAGEFSYPAGGGIPQGQARNLAAAACGGAGKLLSFNANPDGQCGGNICFARVRATCSTGKTTTGPPTRQCERVCR
jgi:hypothetical protein